LRTVKIGSQKVNINCYDLEEFFESKHSSVRRTLQELFLSLEKRRH